MPDIFISYKKEERAVAALLASRFTEAGYDVWWDDALLAGERFEDEISAVLDDSRVVVVLWSKLSVVSDWVKAEAETARQQKKALPTIIDDLPPGKLPLLYRGMHVARLRDWAGDNAHAGFVELMGSIEDRLGKASGPRLTPPEAKAKLAESVDEAKQIIAAAPAEPLTPSTASVSPAPKRRSLPWWAIVLPLVALLGVLGAVVFSQMSRISTADQAAIDRCTSWSGSAELDWVSGFPRLDATTTADCAKAVERFPDNGDYLGMLAMVRVVQGSSYAAEALSLANHGAEKNGAAAYYALGGMYGRGLGVVGDLLRAATNFKASADLGSARAAGRLCLSAMDGNMSLPIAATRDDIDALCKRALDGSDALGQFATGLAFELGTDGRAINPDAAAQYYRQASDQGLDEASVRLGALYDYGIGLERDFGKAVALYQKAANFGFAAAIRSYGVSLELGNGIQQDINKAAQMYETASIRGDLTALLLAGYGTQNTELPSPRNKRDLELLLSDQSLVTARRVSAQLHSRGYILAQDTGLAQSEMQVCVDVNNSMCQVAMGNFYEYGVTGTKDANRARELYQSSADQGNMYGQFWLGFVYDSGDGVPKEPAKALQYYRLAAAQGHLAAKNRLTQLGQPL